MKVKLLVEAPTTEALARWLRQAADTVEFRPFLDRARAEGVVLTAAKSDAKGRIVLVVP